MAATTHPHKPVCRQVSIESPKHKLKDQVFTFDVPVPEVPELGARIRVLCAGVCYRRRDSMSFGRDRSDSNSSTASEGSTKQTFGVRNTAVFPGYEVAGVVEALGENSPNQEIKEGTRVIVYPFDGIAHGYAEYISVPSTEYLIPIPAEVPLPVASMLPTGALWALNAVHDAKAAFDKLQQERGQSKDRVRILVVGTGTLALWAIRLAHHFFGEDKAKVTVTVAALKDEGLADVAEEHQITVVSWNDQLHEAALTERTVNACGGPVDIVIDFGTTTRSLIRALQCLNRNGTVLIGSDTSESIIRRTKLHVQEVGAAIKGVQMGSYDQLQRLVQLVGEKSIDSPPYTLFPAEMAAEAVKLVNRGDVNGHAILQFGEILDLEEE